LAAVASFAASFRGDDGRARVLASALLVSLLAHLALFFVLQLGTQLGWWQGNPLESFARVTLTPEEQARIQRLREQALRAPPEDVPMSFVQVPEPNFAEPERAPFYSAASSRAANPEPLPETGRPRVEGGQTRLPRFEDTPPSPPAPAVAAAPSGAAAEELAAARPDTPVPTTPELPRPEAQVAREAVPERLAGVGLLARATPETVPPSGQPAPRPKPRTIREAKARQPWLAGEKMRQEGGVARTGRVVPDVKGLPFGEYDFRMFVLIEQRWNELINESRYAGDAGRVVIEYKLYHDGSVRVTEPKETTVDALLTAWCIRAITDPAPFGRWPPDMARMIGKSVRDITVTFYYQ
jgi:hypothetical protein